MSKLAAQSPVADGAALAQTAGMRSTLLVPVLLAACGAPTAKTDASGTTTGVSVPAWSGTQIGDEGDEGCPLARSPWTSELEPDGSDQSPAELRAALATQASGQLQSAWQGAEGAELELVPDGEMFLLEELPTDGLSCDGRWLEVESQLRLDAGELLHIDAAVLLRSTAVWAELEDGDWWGALSPGTLPEDAHKLLLVLQGTAEPGTTMDLHWELERADRWEAAAAAELRLD